MENRYYDMLINRSMDRTAENLLAVMLRDVEDILAESGRMARQDPYRRAQVALVYLKERAGKIGNPGERSRIYNQVDILVLFIAVYKTVRVLEGNPL
jgi:hypothetical protein